MRDIQFLEVLKICMKWYDVETIAHCARVVKNLEKDMLVEFLPEEKSRLDALYEELADKTSSGEFSILVEGHTASVGKPNGEMNLSIDRAKTLINEMTSRGISPSIFSFKGYGGTIPLADNNTEEGRAQNRRVEIILIPKATYIQRR